MGPVAGCRRGVWRVPMQLSPAPACGSSRGRVTPHRRPWPTSSNDASTAARLAAALSWPRAALVDDSHSDRTGTAGGAGDAAAGPLMGRRQPMGPDCIAVVGSCCRRRSTQCAKWRGPAGRGLARKTSKGARAAAVAGAGSPNPAGAVADCVRAQHAARRHPSASLRVANATGGGQAERAAPPAR